MDCPAARHRLHEAPLARAGGLDDSPTDDDVRSHAAGCPACALRVDAAARLDGLLASTAPPPVPGDLLGQILAAVALRRAQDARWVRARAPLLVAAAAALVLALGPVGGPLDTWTGPSGWQALLESGLSDLRAGPVASAGAAWSLLLSRAADGLAGLLDALPSPPLLLLLVLGPLLAVANRSVARLEEVPA